MSTWHRDTAVACPRCDEPWSGGHVCTVRRDRCAREGCSADRMRTCVWIYGKELSVCVDHWLAWREAQAEDHMGGGGMGDACEALAAEWGYTRP